MRTKEMNGNENQQSSISVEEASGRGEPVGTPKPAAFLEPSHLEGSKPSPDIQVDRFATRADLPNPGAGEKGKLLLLGGGLLLAVLFFVFTALLGNAPGTKNPPKQPASTQQLAAQNKLNQPRGSVTPLMDTMHTENDDNSTGEVRPRDIKRMRSSEMIGAKFLNLPRNQTPQAAKTSIGSSLASVPSFGDTQQKWEEPPPYVSNGQNAAGQQQERSTLNEPSLVFVRSGPESPNLAPVPTKPQSVQELPALDLAPGTRIQAKLETQISTALQAPVVAVVEYTYALGDHIIVPSGTRVYGHLQQADSSGYVGVRFDELELLDGAREKIDAVGVALDLGPIKGTVYGKNSSKSLLIRAASGLGSVATMLVGNNNSSAFSEDALLRQRVAENLGSAGDAEVLSLAANSRVVVSVPADTKIYVIFAKHEASPATLRRFDSTGQ